jgi:beta-lactamase class A
MKIGHRARLAVLLTALVSACSATPTEPAATPGSGQLTTPAISRQTDEAGLARLKDLERRYEVRLGVFATNVTTGKSLHYRQDERFAMLSTFKTYVAAALLRSHPLSSKYFDQTIHFTQADIVDNSPVTSTRVATGMTVSELCEAAITTSDNTAANQLLKLLGGPAEVTRFARSIGDQVTRLDRWEPELNSALRGDERDTTTPQAIVNAYRAFVLGDVLPTPEREQLKTWLLANTTGGSRIRAGLPQGWITGDKTGSGRFAALNDVAITWTDNGTPIVISVLSDKTREDAKSDSALLAETAKVVVETLR